MLQEMGIEKDRFRLEWISAAEGEKVKSVINDMVGKVKSLGPLGMNTELKQRIDESAEPNESIHEITLKEEVLNHA
jgi:hypothetical protein